jgi:hypothetical protein
MVTKLTGESKFKKVETTAKHAFVVSGRSAVVAAAIVAAVAAEHAVLRNVDEIETSQRCLSSTSATESLATGDKCGTVLLVRATVSLEADPTTPTLHHFRRSSTCFRTLSVCFRINHVFHSTTVTLVVADH